MQFFADSRREHLLTAVLALVASAAVAVVAVTQ